MFEHSGITFTKLDFENLSALLALKNDTWMHTHTTTLANTSDQERWFESLDGNVICPRNLVLQAHREDLPSDNMIGIFKIFNINYVNSTANVAWDIFKPMRGKGHGKRIVQGGVKFCSDILNLRRLDAEILEHNVASIKCAEFAGFVREGVRRQAVYKSGHYIDSVIYGFLRMK